MNTSVVGLRVAAAIFGLVCLAQLARLLMGFEIVVAGRHIPLWLSGIVVVLAGALCFWFWKLAVADKTHHPPGAGASVA